MKGFSQQPATWLRRLPSKGEVALTFDDGTCPSTTPLLLKALNDLKIFSTHFVVGSKCRQYPSLVREISAAGHALGNHSYRHELMLFHSGKYQYDSLRQTNDLIEDLVSKRLEHFRPPYGWFNVSSKSVLRKLNLQGVLWSLIAQDWREQSDQELWKRVSGRLRDGAIILLHDAQPTTRTVISILPRLAEEVSRRNWKFVLLPPYTFATH